MNHTACGGLYHYYPDHCEECPRFMDDCDGADAAVMKDGPGGTEVAHPGATATITLPQGELDFDPATGNVLGFRPDHNGGEEGLAKVLRVDVEEWRATYPDEELKGVHNSLDFGFWYREYDGTSYSAPWGDWRKRHRTGRPAPGAATPKSKTKRRLTRKAAHQLQPGGLLCARVTDPYGGGSTWSPEQRNWIYRSLPAGEVVRFKRVMPKVRVVTGKPWQDGLDELLICTRNDGTRVWLHIGNARRVDPEDVGQRKGRGLEQAAHATTPAL